MNLLTAQNIFSRLTLLNSFSKSTLIRALLEGRLCKIHPHGMDCCFHPTRISKSQLIGGQNTLNSVDDVEACTFRSKPPDGTPHSNWANATISFSRAVSLAPNKRMQTAAGVIPSRIRVIIAVNAFKTLSTPSSAACYTRSFR